MNEINGYGHMEQSCDPCGEYWASTLMQAGLCPECRSRFRVEDETPENPEAGKP